MSKKQKKEFVVPKCNIDIKKKSDLFDKCYPFLVFPKSSTGVLKLNETAPKEIQESFVEYQKLEKEQADWEKATGILLGMR